MAESLGETLTQTRGGSLDLNYRQLKNEISIIKNELSMINDDFWSIMPVQIVDLRVPRGFPMLIQASLYGQMEE